MEANGTLWTQSDAVGPLGLWPKGLKIRKTLLFESSHFGDQAV